VGCYVWYSQEGPGRAGAPHSPLLAVLNLTAHPSTASVPITVLLFDGPLLCGFNVVIKGLINGILTLQFFFLRKLWAALPAAGALYFHLLWPDICPVPTSDRSVRASRAGHRPARCLCGRVHSCANMESPAGGQVHSRANEIIRMADKSIIQMVLRGHQMTDGDL